MRAVKNTISFIGVIIMIAIMLAGQAAFAARGDLVGIRAAAQPNGNTRLVIETTDRPSYKLSYLAEPNRLVIELSNTGGGAAANISDGCLVKSVDTAQDGNALRVTAALRKPISEIPKESIMILSPNGDSGYRLVLDFASGAAATKIATAVTAPPKAAVKNQRKPVIVIDAGHGGKDPGCIGKSGTREKDVVLAVAKKLRDRLADAGYTVYLTRSNDVFLNLNTRADIAEQKKADLFLSLHVNANPSGAVKGFSIYTLSQQASDEETKKLAEAENASDRIDFDGFEKYESGVRYALSAIQQRAVAEASLEFAHGADRTMKANGITEQSNAGMRSAPFAVLRAAVPAALVELGHLSNRDEEKLLNSSAHQNKLVGAIVAAINGYNFEM